MNRGQPPVTRAIGERVREAFMTVGWKDLADDIVVILDLPDVMALVRAIEIERVSRDRSKTVSEVAWVTGLVSVYVESLFHAARQAS